MAGQAEQDSVILLQTWINPLDAEPREPRVRATCVPGEGTGCSEGKEGLFSNSTGTIGYPHF
jgi:hypothetical protein